MGEEMAENGNGTEGEGMDEEGQGLLAPLASNGYVVAGLLATVIAAAILWWLAAWTNFDARPSFEDTLGVALAETSGGLFIGAGLIGALGVLRILRTIERRISAAYRD